MGLGRAGRPGRPPPVRSTPYLFLVTMRLLLCLLVLSSFAVRALAAADTPPAPPARSPAPALPVPAKQKFHFGPWEDEIGYAQAVRVGNTLYVSGSVGAGDMTAAIKSAYGELERTLTAHRLTFAHVVKENLYTTNLDELIAHKDERRAYYGKDFPAATWVQVSRLYRPNFVLEVEVVAVFPDGH